jgi:hypothetical protein
VTKEVSEGSRCETCSKGLDSKALGFSSKKKKTLKKGGKIQTHPPTSPLPYCEQKIFTCSNSSNLSAPVLSLSAKVVPGAWFS